MSPILVNMQKKALIQYFFIDNIKSFFFVNLTCGYIFKAYTFATDIVPRKTTTDLSRNLHYSLTNFSNDPVVMIIS